MIRLAEEKDIDAIIKLLGEVLAIHNEIRGDIFKPIGSKYNHEEVKKIMNNPLTPIYVYVEDDVVLGHLMCQLRDNKETGNRYPFKEMYIDDICIKENARRKGIGKALYQFIKEYAIKNGFKYIALNCWEGNDAKSFYEHLGLTPRSTIMEEKL